MHNLFNLDWNHQESGVVVVDHNLLVDRNANINNEA